jgi:hypothetical protein
VAAGTDFGQRQVAAAEIRGTVFDDADGDGVRGRTELGTRGRVVYLDANDNGSFDAVEQSVTVGSDGAYALRGLAAGTYTVRLLGRGGWVQTTPPAGGGLTPTVAAGAIAANNDFGTQKIDVAPPTVLAATFRIDAGGPAFVVDLDEPVVGLGDGDRAVTNLATGAAYAFTPSDDAASRHVTFRPAAGVTLPGGRYEARLVAQGFADEAGNVFAAARVYDFGILTGDADLDGTVGFADLVAVAQHYGASLPAFPGAAPAGAVDVPDAVAGADVRVGPAAATAPALESRSRPPAPMPDNTGPRSIDVPRRRGRRRST